MLLPLCRLPGSISFQVLLLCRISGKFIRAFKTCLKGTTSILRWIISCILLNFSVVPAQIPLNHFGKKLRGAKRAVWDLTDSVRQLSCTVHVEEAIYGELVLPSMVLNFWILSCLSSSSSGIVGSEKARWLPMHFSLQSSFWTVFLMRDAIAKFELLLSAKHTSVVLGQPEIG